MVLRIDLVELFEKIQRFDRETLQRMKGYLPVVICLLQAKGDPAQFLLAVPEKQRSLWAPPQETIKLDDSIEEAARRCLQDELGVQGGYHILRSQWVGHRTFAEARRDERSIPGSLRTLFGKHVMIGKAYWAALITLDEQIPLEPNPAEIAQHEWVDFGGLHDRLRTNDPGKLEILASAWSMANPRSRQELAAWLRDGGVDTAGWGQGEAKTRQDLWQEVEAGEVLLCRQPLRRCVRVTQIVIRRRGKVLVEQWQEMRRGAARASGKVPAEKMKFGEPPLETAIRCLKEELGLLVDPQELARLVSKGPVRVSASPTLKESPSRSYPGLNSQYWFYSVTIHVDRIPGFPSLSDSAFSTDERDGAVVGHVWDWKDSG